MPIHGCQTQVSVLHSPLIRAFEERKEIYATQSRENGTPLAGREKSLYLKPQFDRWSFFSGLRHIGLKHQYSSLPEVLETTTS